MPLAIREGESPWSGRFKNLIEGAGIGSAVETGLTALGRAFARGRGKTVEQLAPEEVAEFEASPEVQEFMRANGIADSADPRVAVLQERVATRRAAEADPVERLRQGREAPERSDGQGGSAIERNRRAAAARQGEALDKEIEAQRAELQAVEDGQVDPAAANLPQRRPEPPPVIVPERAVDPSVQSGVELRGRSNLPAVVEPQPTRMSPDQIAHAARAADAGQPNRAETPARMTAPEGRAPQTPDDIQGQREADEAFRLAERQRSRVAEDVRDTQPAGRPEGVGAREVFLDDDFPVEILERRFVPDDKGRSVQVAKVRRYDPRTGQPDADAVEYEVPVRQLRRSQYAPEPRRAQDFVERSQSPRDPEQPRMPDEGVTQEPRQTFRATEPDPSVRGADGPADEVRPTRPPRDGEPGGFTPTGERVRRSPFPNQPEGPHPGRARPRNEEEILREFEARQRGETRREEARADDAKASNRAKDADRDGRFVVDDRGYVASDRGGPVRFGDQRQAAKWILNVGHKKSPDQIFEIANHPSGKGFTVRERARRPADEPPDDTPPTGGSRPERAEPADTGAPAQIAPPFQPGPRAMRQVVDDIESGAVAPNADALVQKYGMTRAQGGRMSTWIQSQYFRKTGLHQFTEASRIAMFGIGRTFIRRLALDTLSEGKVFGVIPSGGAFKDSAAILLRELGIPDADARKFAEWVKSKDGMPDIDDLAKDEGMAALYRTAISRFVDQTIMRPTGAQRPRYANHPLGSIVYNLQSYLYSFTKNVLNRSGNLALTAVTREGLNPIERAQMLAPLAMLPGLVGIQYGLGELRDVIFNDPGRKQQKPKTEAEKWMTAVSRAGGFGSLDVPINLVTSMRYQRDPATVMIGPILGGPSDLFSAAVNLSGDRNSPNTNTAERKAARVLYNVVINPALAAGFASLPGGLGFLVGMTGIQGAAHPATREAFVQSVAGEAAPARGQGGSGRGASRPTRGAADRKATRPTR